MKYFLIFFSLFFIACSDRDYGNQDISTMPPLGVKESFSLRDYLPSKYLPRMSYITLEFSSALDGEKDYKEFVILEDTNTSEIINTELEVFDNHIYIKPLSSYKINHKYKVTIKEISDIFGNSLDKQTSFELTCKSDYWENVKAGYLHTLAKSKYGELFSWGSNVYGELSDLSVSQRMIPVPIKIDYEADMFDAGFNNTAIVLKNNTTLITKGANAIPTQVSLYDYLSLGATHGIVIKKDKTLWSFGTNTKGELGNLSLQDSNEFVEEYSKSKDWKVASGGENFTIAIKEDGTLWGWGDNEFAQLGSEDLNQRRTPHQEDNNETNWIYASAGGKYTCAIKSDASIVCFGDNSVGQLGDGSYESNRTKRVVVTNSDNTSWKSVSCGYNHTLALDSNDNLWAWGGNYYGQIGNGTQSNQNQPIKVLDNVLSFSAGKYFSIAIKKDGTMWSWGYNGYFQLGLGEVEDKNKPEEMK